MKRGGISLGEEDRQETIKRGRDQSWVSEISDLDSDEEVNNRGGCSQDRGSSQVSSEQLENEKDFQIMIESDENVIQTEDQSRESESTFLDSRKEFYGRGGSLEVSENSQDSSERLENVKDCQITNETDVNLIKIQGDCDCNIKLNDKTIDFRDFVTEKALNWRSREKLFIVQGKFKDSIDDSVLILQKNPFPENLSDFEKSLSQDKYQIENIMQNDIYGTYSISGMDSINSIKVTVITPATEKHIRKYSKPQIHFFPESPFIYETVTYPFITLNQFSTNWVTNVINGTAEPHRVLYRSEGNTFLIAMDFKWDGQSMDDLHCLAIGGHNAPKSLRELRYTHLSLLKEIYETSLSIVSKKYDTPRSQLRLFVHYPPSFYHLHVHITHVHNDSPSALVDRAHLLSSIIRNIEAKGDYYEHATLDVTVQDNDPLYEIYSSNKCFQ